MWPTLLFRLLVVSGSLKLHVQSKTIICGPHQYTVTNGSSSYCLNCETCHPGYGLYPACGQSVTHPASNIDCKRCPNETFSDEYDSAPCHSCQQCAKLEIVTAPCTRNSDRICNGTCTKGYFFAKKALHTCQQCSYCCFDGKDEEQPECIKQGLNASGRHCSARQDKQCGPSSTATLPSSTEKVTTQGTSLTHLPTTTHSPALTELTISTPHPTNHHVSNPAVIVPSILSGVFFGVLVVAVIFYMYKRKKQTWGQTAQGNRSAAGEEGRNHAQGSSDNNASQVTPSVAYYADPRLRAVQNTGYLSTPEDSPSETPQHTDDEVEELPDVVAVQKKRRLKRQSSKETQNSVLKKDDGADECLLDLNEQAANEGSNCKGQDSKGVGPSRSRSHSLDVLKRKFSFSLEKDDYQPLGEEDPDELQGNGMFEPKPRSGSVNFKAVKRRLSGPEKQQDCSLVTRENPDPDQFKDQLTSYTEPIKIEVEPIHQRQKEGSRVEFKCNVHGIRKVFYQWVKDGTEMQGQNNSSLVLGCVELRDFGSYVCHVSDANADCIIKSSAALLDVAPRDGMDYKCLRQVDDNTQSKVETLLTKNVRGTGGWKQVAIKYGMDEVDRDSLEGSPDAGKITIGYVKATNPDLTVYEFCKTLKEPNIRRFDVVKELLGHLSVPSSEKPHS